MSFVVAIDGPAGTGKGTITKLIAQELGLVILIQEQCIVALL